MVWQEALESVFLKAPPNDSDELLTSSNTCLDVFKVNMEDCLTNTSTTYSRRQMYLQELNGHENFYYKVSSPQCHDPYPVHHEIDGISHHRVHWAR